MMLAMEEFNLLKCNRAQLFSIVHHKYYQNEN
jgi:hypothetical protein